ncbi:phosphoribosylanthranilate isomerase [Thermodesulforhabdus norvegica]|uniref:N-(5'-phosphoribosyl)anthranilate isomerase n=1 Tax=Thermodesulforhabdus norvegica TaxID=39841 RepID=A0A1I4U6R2_9BACT|nr:phosphoribosylanthranilate isomerase [Thermodesulforhabdus norvegica]SFM84639.1 phosphoribosylanthranilate isomerase [Thermodesulforhabdus norvegica]
MKRGQGIFIKICGITSVKDARVCVDAGVDALGFVFYPPSPRAVTAETVRSIISDVGNDVVFFGVFVKESPEEILRIRDITGIEVAQLHGDESREVVTALRREGLKVCKALFAKRKPFFSDVNLYFCDAFLLEAGRSGLGGTGEEWEWREARETTEKIISAGGFALIAGGINPENVGHVVRGVMPSGIDVSSGVELRPGVKDERKVRTLVEKVKGVFHETRQGSTG